VTEEEEENNGQMEAGAGANVDKINSWLCFGGIVA
jgi:hypothetical protein